MATKKPAATKTATKKTPGLQSKAPIVKKEVEHSIVEEYHGWNSEREVGYFLASLIRLTKAQTVLEVGVFEGYTSVEMIKALPPRSMYVGIDIKDFIKPDNKQVFRDAGKEGKIIEFILGNSTTEMPKLQKNHFDLVFIDGNHEFEHVLKEFKIAETLITRTGIIAFHDSIHLDEVKRVVEYAGIYKYKYINLNTPEGRGLALVMK